MNQMKPPNPNPPLLAENIRLRAQLADTERRLKQYQEMTREAYATIGRGMRGEPVEGWLDPKPIEPESNFRLLQRLNQAKNISHSRYEELKRIHAHYLGEIKTLKKQRDRYRLAYTSARRGRQAVHAQLAFEQGRHGSNLASHHASQATRLLQELARARRHPTEANEAAVRATLDRILDQPR